MGMLNPGGQAASGERFRAAPLKDSKTEFTLSIWCENQRGDKIAIGTATGLI